MEKTERSAGNGSTPADPLRARGIGLHENSLCSLQQQEAVAKEILFFGLVATHALFNLRENIESSYERPEVKPLYFVTDLTTEISDAEMKRIMLSPAFIMMQASSTAFRYVAGLEKAEQERQVYLNSATPLEQSLAGFKMVEHAKAAAIEFIQNGRKLSETLELAFGEHVGNELFKGFLENLKALRNRLSTFRIEEREFVVPIEVSAVAPGDVLCMRNGTRASVIKVSASGAAEVVLVPESGEISKQVLSLNYQIHNGAVLGIERSSRFLLPSIPIPHANPPKTWGEIRTGDTLIGSDALGGYREEILSRTVVDNCVVTTSLMARSDGARVLHLNTLRESTETALSIEGHAINVEVRRVPSLRPSLQTRFNFRASATRERTIMSEIGLLALGEIESVATNLMVQQLTAARQGMIEEETVGEGLLKRPKASPLLAKSLERLQQLQTLSKNILERIEILATYCDTVHFSKIMDSCAELQKVYRNVAQSIDHNLNPRQIDELLHPLESLGDHLFAQGAATLEARKITTSNQELPLLRDQYQAILRELRSNLGELFDEAKDSRTYLNSAARYATMHFRKEEIFEFTFLQELSALIKTSPAGIAASIGSTKGTVVTDYSPEVLGEKFSHGMECLTMRDSTTNALMAAILFYPPGVSTEEADEMRKRIPPHYKAERLGELVLIVVHPEAQGGVGFPLLMDAHLLHLLRLGAEGGFSEIASSNRASQHATETWGRGRIYPLHARAVDVHDAPADAAQYLGWLLLVYSVLSSDHQENLPGGIRSEIGRVWRKRIEEGKEPRPEFALK